MWPNIIWSLLGNVSHVHLRRMYILLLGDKFCIYISVRSIWSIVLKSAVSLLIFLGGCSIPYCKWNIEIPYYYYIDVNFCLQICWYLLDMFRRSDAKYIYSWYIFQFNWPLYYYVMTSLSVKTVLDLKCILSDMSIATLAFFSLFYHLHEISFSSPSLSACMYL